ncbi:MAG: helix-turn-helix domain-containing protein [Bacteroidota bacterium]
MAKKNVCKIVLSLLVLSFTFIHNGNSQEFHESIADTLSFEKIYDIYLSDIKEYQLHLFPVHVQKAKRLKDTLQWAQAYRMKAWDSQMEAGLKYVDTAFRISNGIKRIRGKEKRLDSLLGRIHLTKAKIFYENDFNTEALYEFIQSYRYGVKAEDHDLVSSCIGAIADIKAFFGQENESLILAKRSMLYMEKHKQFIPRYNQTRAHSLELLARTYLHLREIDSSQKYIAQSMEISKEIQYGSMVNVLNVLKAQSYYYSGDFKKAKDTLLKYSNDHKTPKSVDDLYYLGEIEGKLGRIDLKKNHFYRIDSILNIKNYPLLDNINSIYQFLLQEAIQEKDTISQKEYFNRLVYYDTLLTRTQKSLRAISLHEFDLPLAEEEKDSLTRLIQSKKKWLNIFYILSSLLLLGTAGYYFKYQNTQKKLTAALNYPVIAKSSPTSGSKTILDSKLNEEAMSAILSKLEVWEKEKGFLDSTINQQDLAKQLGTNSTYLSQAINLYKGQNFSSYIKDLRITLAINALKENPDLAKEKSMIQLAELFGFNSLSVFNKAFKGKLGITPGIFLKSLLKG